MKKLTYILSAVLSLVLLFSHLNPVLADSTPSTSLGTTSFYTTQTEQEQEVKVYRDLLKYNIATPLQIPANSIPATKEEFDTKYVPNIVKALGDGSVTKAWFDFQGVDSPTAGKQLFTVNAPLGQKIYSVVAGKPLQQCPLEIQDTQISFFLDQNKATQKAEELDKKGYFIYVSPSEELRKKVLDNLYDQYSVGKNPACFLVVINHSNKQGLILIKPKKC
jgi:hypothetical protein